VIASEVQVKILIAMYQVLNGIGDVFPIEFPDLYQICMDGISSAFGYLAIELPAVMPIACVVQWNFYGSMLVSTLLPLAIISVSGLVGLWAKGKLNLQSVFRKGEATVEVSALRKWVGDKCFTANFFIMFILYPTLSQTIFKFFDCETFDGVGEERRRFLRVDLSIDCDSEAHTGMLVAAVMLLLVYPIGIPCYFARMLYTHRHDLRMIRHEEVLMLAEMAVAKQTAMQRTKSVKASKGLVETLVADGRSLAGEGDTAALIKGIRGDDKKKFTAKIGRIEGLKAKHLDATVRKLLFGYEMRCYWFELFECARKLLLIGLPVFLYEYPTIQVTFALFLCFASFGLYCQYRPFLLDDLDKLKIAAEVSIFATLLSSIVLRASPNNSAVGVMLAILCVLLHAPSHSAPALLQSSQLWSG